MLVAAWMLFLDNNDVSSVLAKRSRNRKLKKEIQYYENKIGEVQRDHQALKSSYKEMERFAREKYRMKRENEDVYIIEESN